MTGSKVATAHIATFPLQKPFVDCLAAHLLQRFKDTPERLAQSVIFLPSRRAALSLREAFLRASGARAMLLPRLLPLANLEEELLLTESWLADSELVEALTHIPPVIPDTERLLCLAQLIEKTQPGSSSQSCSERSLRLAQQLMELLDDMQREKVDFAAFKTLVPEEYSSHWAKTLVFFNEIAAHWPKKLRELGYTERAIRHNMLVEALIAAWQKRSPEFPVFAAGSTGSHATTAGLLQTIAHLQEGGVFLPALDIQLSQAIWKSLPNEEMHPQAGLARLLATWEMSRQEVDVIDMPEVPPSSTQDRAELVRLMFYPAAFVSSWIGSNVNIDSALQDVEWVASETQRGEAQAIAVKVRFALNEPGKQIGIVTHDRELARMIKAELHAFSIEADDSAGVPLLSTPLGVFFRLLADYAGDPKSGLKLLSLLKHPFAACGHSPKECRKFARLLEQHLLRQVRFSSAIPELLEELQAMAGKKEADDVRFMLSFMQTLDRILSPLLSLARKERAYLQELLLAHRNAAVSLATTDTEEGWPRLFKAEEGGDFAETWQSILSAVEPHLQVGMHDYPAIFNRLFAGSVFRSSYRGHPRVQLLTPIEARMQHFDVMILAGMNEGSWPPPASVNAWMSRSMLIKAGLTPPERMTGLSAHDFFQLCMASEVMITYAKQVGGTEAMPSRWVQRLQACASALHQTPYFWPTSQAQQIAEQRHAERINLPPITEPEACPPIDQRPTRFTVAEIDRLQKNPYEVYAKLVLGLKKPDALEELPSARHFGTLIHEVMRRFSQRFPDHLPDNAAQCLLEEAHHELATYASHAAAEAYWLPRFEACIPFLLQQEEAFRKRAPDALVEAEVRAVDTLRGGRGNRWEIRTRADRVEMTPERQFALVDYKTGSSTTPAEVRRGEALQLPLEATLLKKNRASEGIEALPHKMEYWKLAGRRSEVTVIAEDNATCDDLMALAEEIIGEMIDAYSDPAQRYLVWPTQKESEKRFDDYRHLAREEEWA